MRAVAAFIERRLGREAVDALVGPFLVGGIASRGADALASALSVLFWVGAVPLAGLLLLPFVIMPVLGVGIALALTGWLVAGLAVIALGIVAPRLSHRRSHPAAA